MNIPKETIEIEITDLSDMGQGIGRIDGVVVFVDNALPGDVVKAEIYEKRKKFYKAKTIETIKSTPNRVSPKCPYSKECGGCAMMSLDYNIQLQIKESHLKEKLERIGGVEPSICQPIISMGEPYFYRNKTEFTLSKKGHIGFNRQGTNQVVDIPECCISSPVANKVSQATRTFLQKNNLGIKKITVRTSFSTGETMVIFHTSNPNQEELIPLVELLDDEIYDMKQSTQAPPSSLESAYIYNENKNKKPYTLIAGKPTIEDEVMDLKFEISPQSFYQTNPTQAKELFSKVKEYAAPTGQEKVIDLYCGVGSIGLTLANSVKEVKGIEVVKEAILDANRNAVVNKIINATYQTGKAEDLIGTLELGDENILLLDPPRAGCKKEVLEAIGSSHAKKVIYVSCDPGTFARDVKILTEYGFKLENLTPIDMFPQTIHLELVSLFTR